MAGTYVTADGGVTKSPTDQKTDGLFGGGILGGLDLEPYLKDYDLSKTYKATPNYQPITKQEMETGNNNGTYVLIAVVLGGLALIKILFD